MEALILLATVQRTGTRSVLELLAPDGGKRRRIFRGRAAEQHDVIVSHLENDAMAFVLSFPGEIVTTVRDEQLVRNSWRRMGWDEAELEIQFANHRRLLRERTPYVVRIG